MATREDIMTALLARLAGAWPFAMTGRRNRSPETFTAANSPALILVEHMERYEVESPSLPPKRALDVLALVYCDIGQDENAIPATVLNNILDGFDAALAPDSHGHGRCTLGGRVHSCRIDGEIERSSGDMTGKAMAVVPIRIHIP